MIIPMARLWISPDGHYLSTTSHEQAARVGGSGEPIHLSYSSILLTDGWVRYSEGSVEGRPEFIEKNWKIISDFAQSDVIRYGMNMTTWFDIWDEYTRVRSFSVPLGVVAGPHPPAGVYGEPSVVQQYRSFRRPEPREVRVSKHTRRA
jgi:hypothetical protein